MAIQDLVNFFKCLIMGHQWAKDKAGFDPLKGCYFRAWNCKRCRKIEFKRYALPGDKEVEVDDEY